MLASRPLPVADGRPPSVSATCSCEHPLLCNCACHGRDCDSAENSCDLAFLPDDGGHTREGCATCTPGAGLAHFPGCETIGWSVPVGRDA